MRYEIVLAPGAVVAMRQLPARLRAEVRDAIDRHLRFEPARLSRSRIKRLRGVSRPQYRLRVGDIRVFYDVAEATVEILAVISKEQAQAWLDTEGKPEARGGPRGSEG